jgi:hypothetical protein
MIGWTFYLKRKRRQRKPLINQLIVLVTRGGKIRIHNSQEPTQCYAIAHPILAFTLLPAFLKTKDHSTATEDSTAGENMLKQPLITMSNASSEDEGQTKLQKERQSRSIICKSFLLGSSFGFAFQAMSYAAYYMLSKMFGSDTTPTPDSISQLDLAIYIAMTLPVVYTNTKSGSLYMRKKFDKDAANPNSGSIWTTRMLFMFGLYVVVGVNIGSVSFRVGVALYRGMAVIPWISFFLFIVMFDVVTLLLVVKWFDWSHPIEQELEDDHSCIV